MLSRCQTTWFFFLFCDFFQWSWRGWRRGASNVTARESLSWIEGFVYRVNQGCTNPWLPLTFTRGPFPINLQGPPPLEAWLRPPPPPNKLIHIADKGCSPNTALRHRKGDKFKMDSNQACLHIRKRFDLKLIQLSLFAIRIQNSYTHLPPMSK